MRKILIAIALSFMLVQGSLAADNLLKPNHPDRYIVKQGDTLWDISSMFLADAWRWPELWNVNPAIKNPHLIFPGDQIALRYVDGKPQLLVSRGDEGRTIRLTPEPNADTKLLPKVRAEPLTSSIPAIPLGAIAALLNTGRIVGPGTLENAPHILAGEAERLVFGPGDRFYARGQWGSETSVYGIFRQGEVYQDPVTREVLGFEALGKGVARVLRRADDLYTMRVTSIQEDVRIGDRLLPTEERRVESMFYPASPDEQINGVVMTLLGGATLIGKNQVVAVNRGEINGLEVGHVLAIYKAGKIVRDKVRREKVSLPAERIGLLMVFRTFEKMAYGLVLQTDEPIRVGDLLQNP
jgi:nucleoid-associated protein YgaU